MGTRCTGFCDTMPKKGLRNLYLGGGARCQHCNTNNPPHDGVRCKCCGGRIRRRRRGKPRWAK